MQKTAHFSLPLYEYNIFFGHADFAMTRNSLFIDDINMYFPRVMKIVRGFSEKSKQ